MRDPGYHGRESRCESAPSRVKRRQQYLTGIASAREQGRTNHIFAANDLPETPVAAADELPSGLGERILDTLDKPLRLPTPALVVQFRERMYIGSDRLGALGALHRQAGLSSASSPTPQVGAQALRKAPKPVLRRHGAFDHEQLPPASAP